MKLFKFLHCLNFRFGYHSLSEKGNICKFNKYLLNKYWVQSPLSNVTGGNRKIATQDYNVCSWGIVSEIQVRISCHYVGL